jgi:hypothetical protein
MAVRVLLIGVALAVVGWVGVLLRDYDRGHEAALRGFYRPQPSAAGRAHDLDRLKDAELLDPDSYWKLSRASYHLLTGDKRVATGLASEIVRSEPENVSAWRLLLQAARGMDGRSTERAHAMARRLDPLDSP